MPIEPAFAVALNQDAQLYTKPLKKKYHNVTLNYHCNFKTPFHVD
jgi:hypothetical protein